jgi:LemA protein
MAYDTRIEQMIAAGTLTQEQAEALYKAADRTSAARSSSLGPHRPLPLGLLAGVAIIGILAMLVMAGSGEQAPAIIQDVNQTINTPEGVGAMNRTAQNLTSFAIFGLPLILALLYFVSVYNGLVKTEEAVYSAWADVESTYKRRADLIPNVVSTVNSYMKHEKETLTAVTDQRNDIGEALKKLADQQTAAESALTSAKPDNESAVAEVERSQSALSQTLRGVLATAEAYPDLRSADQFLTLQAELEGTENRINVARMRFNEEVQAFNSNIRKLPGSLVAGVGNFKRKAYFTAAAQDEVAPTVKLGE